ncbi:hypothetical protein BWQ96_10014 [Gracilariopsis chorda]|uniref:Uncharacterized protein n=1 Tax=Gracilariopsis chorda TaxID=448386 RepID=A0A2V3IDW6_9FLOR|nr:hypothetical protein BWQ96_10731 [Gracilariopsis chorda]PXF40275.1 hypothetical protein BWQ96_10014 [Gracilariopsis chorda]|eukprot:PXF39572.1 hypothetical protein BWQ96_10731 [Gracilariopsis chorda]
MHWRTPQNARQEVAKRLIKTTKYCSELAAWVVYLIGCNHMEHELGFERDFEKATEGCVVICVTAKPAKFEDGCKTIRIPSPLLTEAPLLKEGLEQIHERLFEQPTSMSRAEEDQRA